MAIFSGKNGKAFWDAGGAGETEILNISEWTADVQCSTSEANYMGEEWTQTVANQKGWTASINCYFDDAGLNIDLSADDAESLLTVELWLTATATDGLLTGTAIVTDMSVSTPADGIVTVNYQLTGSGAIALATTTATS